MDYSKTIKNLTKRAEIIGRYSMLVQFKKKIEEEIKFIDLLIEQLDREEENANQ
mgnify:CR=1 FL=1